MWSPSADVHVIKLFQEALYVIIDNYANTTRHSQVHRAQSLLYHNVALNEHKE